MAPLETVDQGADGTAAIGVDVGGTKISTGLVSRDGELLTSDVRPTPAKDAAGLVRAIVESVGAVSAQVGCGDHRVCGLGIGLPAALDGEARTVRWAPNVPALNGFPLAERVEQAAGLPVILGYDGHVAALGEQWVGAGRGVRNMILIAIGTGIGGGIIADGRLIQGARLLAGAFGWMVLGEPYEEAPQGGWLEGLAAGPHIPKASCARAAFTSTEQVFARAKAGDPLACQVVAKTGVVLGKAISNLVSILDTELVVLAGGVGARSELLVPYIERQIEEYCPPHIRGRVPVRLAQSGRLAGTIGSARLVLLKRFSPPELLEDGGGRPRSEEGLA